MNKSARLIGSIARTLLALTFLFSGFVKAIDPIGTVYKIEDYLTAFGGFFSSLLPLATTAAVLLILTEWTLGVMMLCNIRTQWTAWLSLAFYLVMTPLTLPLMSRPTLSVQLRLMGIAAPEATTVPLLAEGSLPSRV